MFNLRKIFIAVFFIALLFPAVGRAANPVELYFFEGQGCQYCTKMKSYLEGLKVDYPNLTVREFEVYFNKENQLLFENTAKIYDTTARGVPTLFIDNEVIDGADFEKVKSAVERCSVEECVSPSQKFEAAGENGDENSNVNQSPADGPAKNEIVGWVVIGVVAAFGALLIYFVLKRKQ